MEPEALTRRAYVNLPLWVVYPATVKFGFMTNTFEPILHGEAFRVYGYLG
jgi:hypothetical protein